MSDSSEQAQPSSEAFFGGFFSAAAFIVLVPGLGYTRKMLIAPLQAIGITVPKLLAFNLRLTFRGRFSGCPICV